VFRGNCDVSCDTGGGEDGSIPIWKNEWKMKKVTYIEKVRQKGND
jgi:hypothetical protein